MIDNKTVLKTANEAIAVGEIEAKWRISLANTSTQCLRIKICLGE